MGERDLIVIVRAMWNMIGLACKLLSMLLNHIYRRGGLKAVLGFIGVLVVIGIAGAVVSSLSSQPAPASPTAAASPSPSSSQSPSSDHASAQQPAPSSSKAESIPSSGSKSSSSQPSTGSGSEEAAVEDMLRKHYDAIGTRDYDKVYADFTPTFQQQHSKQDWINDMKSLRINHVNINSVKVNNVSGDKATAAVDYSSAL